MTRDVLTHKSLEFISSPCTHFIYERDEGYYPSVTFTVHVTWKRFFELQSKLHFI